MAKRFYVISKKTGIVNAEHDTRLECETYIRNAHYLFGNQPDDYVIAEGAKDRDNILKGLKETAPYRR